MKIQEAAQQRIGQPLQEQLREFFDAHPDEVFRSSEINERAGICARNIAAACPTGYRSSFGGVAHLYGCPAALKAMRAAIDKRGGK